MLCESIISILADMRCAFSMIVPRNPHTNIGDSEHTGGMKTYCSPDGRYSSQQGQLPDDWWSHVAFKTGKGKNGQRYAQRASHLPLLIISAAY